MTFDLFLELPQPSNLGTCCWRYPSQSSSTASPYLRPSPRFIHTSTSNPCFPTGNRVLAFSCMVNYVLSPCGREGMDDFRRRHGFSLIGWASTTFKFSLIRLSLSCAPDQSYVHLDKFKLAEHCAPRGF